MSEKTQKLYKTDMDARELAEKLFRESGIEFEGEFFAHVMATYELQQMKNGLGAGYQKIISNAEYHAKSLIDALTSIIQTEQGDRIHLSEVHEEKLNDLANELSTQQDEIIGYREREKLMIEEQAKLIKLSADQQKEIAATQQINEKNETILTENKERIERLSKMVSDGQDAVIQKQQMELRISEISEISKQQAKDLKEASESLEALRMAQEEQIKQLMDKHTDELLRAGERADIAQEKAVFVIRRELTDLADKERTEFTKQLQAVEREHSTEIRRLYGEMDKLRQQFTETKTLPTKEPKVNVRGKGQTSDETK